METKQNSTKNNSFMSLKKYITKRTNKLLPYSEICEQALSYTMLGKV